MKPKPAPFFLWNWEGHPGQMAGGLEVPRGQAPITDFGQRTALPRPDSNPLLPRPG